MAGSHTTSQPTMKRTRLLNFNNVAVNIVSWMAAFRFARRILGKSLSFAVSEGTA